MDILDIDEMLKDDSFHFLEEKNPDDVSNIIQQWKNQNSMQQQQQQHDIQQQQQLNDTYKLDSRTFTRPKRRTAVQKLEMQFLNINNGSESQQQQPTTPILNVQIGGQVRTPISARSMLQDVSPPFSISSMDTSLDNLNMDNSLITSADFTHLNFLLSTPSLERNVDFNDQNCAGYTLSDMIRDRKALESLTLSADDGTLIKDSHISQIDDISLSLLKSSSGCNSMANSAESEEGSHLGLNGNFNDRTMLIMGNIESNSCNQTLTGNGGDSSALETVNRTTVANSNNGNSDTTFTCLANGQSFIISRQPAIDIPIPNQNSMQQMLLNTTWDQQAKSLESQPLEKGTEHITTMKQKATALNETVCIRETDDVKLAPESAPATTVSNETFDCQQLQDELHKLQHTPENKEIDIKSAKMYESTPHTNRIRYGGNKNSYTPAIRKIIEDPNISPIVAMDFNQQQPPNTPKKTEQTAGTYCGSPVSHLTGLDLLENVENPNKTYNRRSRLRQKELDDEREQRHKNTIELQDIMDLAQAEAELLDTANGGEDDEQQFEHMLDELSRIKLNPEQLKMQKSLDKIKKRFNCTLNQTDQDASLHPHTSTSSNEYGSGLSNTFTSETRQETLRKLRDTFRHDTTAEMSETASNSTDPALISSGSAVGSGCGGSSIVSSMSKNCSNSERLLNRRSRLNDDINLTSVKQLSLSSGNNASFTVPTKETNASNNENPSIQRDVPEIIAAQSNAKTDNGDAGKYKLSEHRERDRDRFKTIKIIRNKTDDNESATQTVLNVPCIDDDHNEIFVTPLESEGNNDKMSLANENESCKNEMKPAPSNRFSRSDLEKPEKGKNSGIVASALRQPESRSLSRPRYISGLQKFSAVSKAASADDLETKENSSTTNETKTSQLSRMYDAKRTNIPGNISNSTAKPTNKLKSPMGTKAKSLHNLAYNNQGSTTAAGVIVQTRIGAFGLRKINSGGFGFEQQRTQKPSQQQNSQLKQKTVDGFKKPQPLSGLQSSTTREKGSNATNRAAAGIARPSSAYYSLNVIPKTDVFPAASNQFSDMMKPFVNAPGNIAATDSEESKISKNSTNTSIPKPSGIRPPNKRSGLPRPASIVRR